MLKAGRESHLGADYQIIAYVSHLRGSRALRRELSGGRHSECRSRNVQQRTVELLSCDLLFSTSTVSPLGDLESR